jgi:hypothetical protein
MYNPLPPKKLKIPVKGIIAIGKTSTNGKTDPRPHKVVVVPVKIQKVNHTHA